MAKHWSNEDLINRLYETAAGDESHLLECDDCRERWEALLVRRQEVLAEPSLPAELLADQRRQIYRQLEEESSGSWNVRLAPALAALSIVVMGLPLLGPSPAPEPTTIASNNDGFFTEIYAMVESSEPEAIAPLRSLFEE